MHRDRKENGNFQGGWEEGEWGLFFMSTGKVGKATQQYGCTYCHRMHSDKWYIVYYIYIYIYISVCCAIIKLKEK